MSADADDWDDDGGGLPNDDAVSVDVSGLAPGSARLFPFVREGVQITGIVVNHEGTLHVYVNRCPHVPYSLDFGDGNVMGPGGGHLFCSTHGGQFRPESGVCFGGPPRGRRLEPLAFSRDGDTIHVTITAEPAGWPREF